MPLRSDYCLTEAEESRAGDLYNDPRHLFDAINDALASLDYHDGHTSGDRYVPPKRTAAPLVAAFRDGNADEVYRILKDGALAYLRGVAVDEIQEEADDLGDDGSDPAFQFGMPSIRRGAA